MYIQGLCHPRFPRKSDFPLIQVAAIQHSIILPRTAVDSPESQRNSALLDLNSPRAKVPLADSRETFHTPMLPDEGEEGKTL